MIPLNPWEHQNAIKALYSKCVAGVCTKHGITRMELDILLFLVNNPCYDTATDMIETRFVSKSQVSVSIKLLEKRGYLRKEYVKDNRKTAHLKVCRGAFPVIEDGRKAQENFISIMLQGFGQEEIEHLKQYFERMWGNINIHLKEEEE